MTLVASDQTALPTAGQWARDLAESYDAIAARAEGHEQHLTASLNRSEAAKYHRIAADMDAAFPGGARPAGVTA